MKKVLLLPTAFLFAGAAAAVAQQKSSGNYQLTIHTGDVTIKPGKLYLQTLDESGPVGEVKTDSATVTDDVSYFRGRVAEPTEAMLSAGPDLPVVPFMLEPGNTSITWNDSQAGIQVTGSAIYSEYISLNNQLSPVDARRSDLLTELGKFRDSADSLEASQVWASIDSCRKASLTIYAGYITSHAQTSAMSVQSIKRMLSFINGTKDIQLVDSLYGLLSAEFKKYPSAVAAKKKIDALISTSIGQRAPEFSQTDTSGKKVSLASFRGDYVLIDFWASWCHPCRDENPNLRHAYERFHKSGFQIISISLDSQKESWLKAIDDDKIGAWTHLSDLKSWKNAVGQQYNINAVPQNFLVDPKGVIVASNLRGNELDRELEKFLGTNR